MDHNVYQDLKNQEHQEVYRKILAAKKDIVFCFSEAHLYDLNQDYSDKKFEDMQFIETIADANCYFFTDRTVFSDRTPRQYYDDFDWTDTKDFSGALDEFSEMMMEIFKQIPLPFNYLIQEKEIPPHMPVGMKSILLQPTNFYDFMIAMRDYSESVSTDQIQFREQLKFLHQNTLLQNFYQSANIEGYNGFSVTDRSAFLNSYARTFISNDRTMSRYDLFLYMYHGLEIYGFVKGKPKKQKMTNLINDGRHAFFGTVCDIIVSKDKDFLAKTKFMYDIDNVRTRVVPAEQLDALLDEIEQSAAITIDTLLDEMAIPLNEKEILHQNEDAEMLEQFVRLKHNYYLYFNLLGYMNDEYGCYLSTLKEKTNYELSTLVKQIGYITTRLLNELGPDVYKKGALNKEENIQNKTGIRTWVVGNFIISLILDDTLYLNFYSIEYIRKRSEGLRSKGE